jgi:hypothetical protein
MVGRARVLLITFLGGMVFALLLTERWRRLGETSTVVAPDAGEADVPAPAAGGIRGRVVTPVVAGVKKDVTWAKAKAGRVTHHEGAEPTESGQASTVGEPATDEARSSES